MSVLRKNTPANATPTKAGRTRDLIWGRPVFKAPTLPNPRTIFDPMPFIDTRGSAFGSDRAGE